LFQLNKLSAQVWNKCVELDKSHKEQTGKHISRWDLQNELKGYVNLHARGIQYVIKKYSQNVSDMWASRKKKHDESSKVKLPYKTKKYYVTGWDAQCLKICDNYILLAKPIQHGKYQKPYKCFVKNPPNDITEVELIHRGGTYYLAIRYKVKSEYLQIQSQNKASIDLGEIHSITSIDNNGNAVIITGRKLRSIKDLRNINLARLRSKRDRCKRHSRQWYKYNKAIQKLIWKFDKKILDATHKITKLYVNYCLKNNISTVYYGDLDSCTRDTKGKINRIVGQKLNQWNYGELIQILKDKLNKYNIIMVKVKEYYSSKKCPICGELNKPSGRNYKCANCKYIMHRDVNGAINILNDNSNYKVTKYSKLEYLRIA
jgi:putative transposase